MESYWKLSLFVWLSASFSLSFIACAVFFGSELFEILPFLYGATFCISFPVFFVLGMIFRCIRDYYRSPSEQYWALYALYCVSSVLVMVVFAKELNKHIFFVGPIVLFVLMACTRLGMYVLRSPEKESSLKEEIVESDVKRLLPLPISFFEESALLRSRQV